MRRVASELDGHTDPRQLPPVAFAMHGHGMNIRHLKVLHGAVKLQPSRSAVEVEMVARSVLALYDRRARECHRGCDWRVRWRDCRACEVDVACGCGASGV